MKFVGRENTICTKFLVQLKKNNGSNYICPANDQSDQNRSPLMRITQAQNQFDRPKTT